MSEIFGLREIKKILPHRAPMLMLDRAEKVDDTHSAVRFCMSWATTEQQVDALITDLAALLGQKEV